MADPTGSFPLLPDDVKEDDFIEDETSSGVTLPTDLRRGRKRKPGLARTKTKTIKPKKVFPHVPGRSRAEVANSLEMVPPKAKYLQRIAVRPKPGPPDHIAEVYTPPRITQFSQEYDLQGALSADKDTGWDFTILDKRIHFMSLLQLNAPGVLFLSPPCTLQSNLQEINWFRKKTLLREAQMEESMLHIQFCLNLVSYQVSKKRFFVWEHPKNALTWKLDCVKEVRNQLGDDSFFVDFDQCQYGLKNVKGTKSLTHRLTSPVHLDNAQLKPKPPEPN